MGYNDITGYSPQMKVFVTPDIIIFKSKSESKFIVFLMLAWLPLVLFAIDASKMSILITLAYAVFASFTYSKNFSFNNITMTLDVRIVRLGIKKEYHIPFSNIDVVQSVNYSFRRGIDLIVKVNGGKRFVIDTTENDEYISKSLRLIGNFLPTETASRFFW
jgi:hypothetical protein